jgi:hypothetical protein
MKIYLQQTAPVSERYVVAKVKYTSSLPSREIKVEFLIASVRWQDYVNKSDFVMSSLKRIFIRQVLYVKVRPPIMTPTLQPAACFLVREGVKMQC